jgi:hypothetical protein
MVRTHEAYPGADMPSRKLEGYVQNGLKADVSLGLIEVGFMQPIETKKSRSTYLPAPLQSSASKHDD